MDPGFFERFYPKVISVQKRDPTYWEEKNCEVLIQSASIRNFFYIFDGTGHVELDETRHMLSSGSMFHVPLRSRFLLASSADRPLLYYSVHYDYKLIEWEGETADCRDPDNAGLPFESVMQLRNQDGLVAEMQRLYEVWTGKDTGYEWKSRVAFLNVLNEISEQKRIELGDYETTQSIIRSMEYIRNHYDEPLKRNELAENVSLSINHFSFLFKQYSGYSPMQYITRVRLDNAKHMLRNSSLPISEVAQRVGFQDPLYFARVFAKETGFSPRAYRKA
ncbi:helix-turn-helix domain-containing protein [Paenibacillus ginsengarvi]|uniref:AraC family transcriptional regulator n=1 Tax=Paenibacillus ginsengarvi TaxID=400777 RepID=A0A3B0CHZ1_9BACL|nr:AraC family transcriptional regulator [Paenibacillus ginsengarvi]RKN85295.1 AraC family transcriptional regulator [Paenibacillus ginsengarvi]